jgi:DNA-binding PadR family transcriptional regulator
MAVYGGLLLVTLMLSFVIASPARAQAPSSPKEPAKEPAYEVEYYYKVQWGHADEWLALFKKNHLPVLKALKEQGRIVEIEMERPRYHATEDGRWDFRVTLAWKNFAASNDPGTEQALIRKLFPDQETFKREERRRFEILLAHWDLPIVAVSLEP